MSLGSFVRQEADRWIPEGAALTASGWESPGILEPTVLCLGPGDYRMWYRGGGVHQENAAQVGYATSADGRSWTKYGSNPILGQGVGGEANSVICPHMAQYTAGGTFYLYYSEITTIKLKVATSANGYSGFTVADTGISLPSGCTVFGNMHPLKVGSTYYLFIEAYVSASGFWGIYLASSSSPTSGFSYLNSGNRLSTLQVAAGGTFGGIHVEPAIDGTYHAWYHANPAAGNGPSDIYRAYSTDLITWTQWGRIVQHSGTGYEVDQLADPSVLEAEGETLLYVDADDNTTGIAAIELFSFGGSAYQLVTGR